MLSTPCAAHVPAGKLAFEQLVAHLRDAGKYPLRVACIGTASFIDEDSEAEPISFDRTVHLVECASLIEAISNAEIRIALNDIPFGVTTAIRYAPRIITIVDRDGRLVVAGEVCAGAIDWCEPVRFDGEARMIVTEASRLRGMAFAASERGDAGPARDLRFQAALLEAQLVDPVWRETAAELLRLPQAALSPHFLNQPGFASGFVLSGA